MSARVDVLAVLERVAMRLRSPQRLSRTAQGKEAYAAQVDEARAAVAELIEAAKECEARLAIHIKHTEDLVAHMRICAALSRIGAD